MKKIITGYENYEIYDNGDMFNYYTTKTNQSCKVVIQLSLQGKYIAEFPSVREAARVLNLDSSTISKVCRGQNKTHGGFIFKYKD